MNEHHILSNTLLVKSLATHTIPPSLPKLVYVSSTPIHLLYILSCSDNAFRIVLFHNLTDSYQNLPNDDPFLYYNPDWWVKVAITMKLVGILLRLNILTSMALCTITSIIITYREVSNGQRGKTTGS